LGLSTYAYSFETGIYRPPSEGGSNSLLVRFTRNCPWNRCRFCAMYKTERFQLRPLAEIKQDIDAMAGIRDELTEISGGGGETGISRRAAVRFLGRHPALNEHPGFPMLFNWLISGGRTAFLQDANSLLMKTGDLVEALSYLRRRFPSIERVTSYARSRTLAQKSGEDLAAIRAAGLDRLHVGLETGDDSLLAHVKKGVDSEGLIKGGRKALEAGFELSEYWMPGLGGKAFSKTHALQTARVLSAINPHYIRSRPFRPLPGTQMYEDCQKGDLVLLTPQEELDELRRTMEALDVSGRVCFDHAGNYWRTPAGGLVFTQDYEGYKFPEEKPGVLSRIEAGRSALNQRPGFMRM
jgi:radical SAM superfamily enzyme YgiQ (UPF0313 family)